MEIGNYTCSVEHNRFVEVGDRVFAIDDLLQVTIEYRGNGWSTLVVYCKNGPKYEWRATSDYALREYDRVKKLLGCEE